MDSETYYESLLLLLQGLSQVHQMKNTDLLDLFHEPTKQLTKLAHVFQVLFRSSTFPPNCFFYASLMTIHTNSY